MKRKDKAGDAKMDMKKYEEGEHLSADMVDKSPSKTLIFLNSGEEKSTEYGNRVQFLIEIDLKKKLYKPNRKSVGALNKAWGTDSNLWVGKRAQVHVEVINNKRSIIATPITPPTSQAPQEESIKQG